MKFKKGDKVKYKGDVPYVATVLGYYDGGMVEIRFESGDVVVYDGDLVLA